MKTALIILFICSAFVVNAQTPFKVVELPIVKIEGQMIRENTEATYVCEGITFKNPSKKFDDALQHCICPNIIQHSPPMGIGIQIRHHLNISYWD